MMNEIKPDFQHEFKLLRKKKTLKHVDIASIFDENGGIDNMIYFVTHFN